MIKWDEIPKTNGYGQLVGLHSKILPHSFYLGRTWIFWRTLAAPIQSIFVLDIEGYVWVVPFVMDSAGDIVLKTALS